MAPPPQLSRPPVEFELKQLFTDAYRRLHGRVLDHAARVLDHASARDAVGHAMGEP